MEPTTLQQYEACPRQIKGPALTAIGEPPASKSIIDQTQKICGKIDGSKPKHLRLNKKWGYQW
jgi:hypothetical protein